jgi:hypothetical protein
MEHDLSGWPDDEAQLGHEFGGEHGELSPSHEQSPSPFYEQNPSPLYEQGPSPFHEQSPSPFDEQGPSPFGRLDQSPDYVHDYGAPDDIAASGG